MADLSTLANMFVQSSTPQGVAPSQQGKPWQTELMNQIDPQRMQKQRIASALGTAAAAMLASKGGALHGIAQGIVGGAQKWNDQGQADDARRIEAQRMIDQENQQDEERRLGHLRDAITVQGGMEDRAYGRKKDAAAAAAATEKETWNRRYKERELDVRKTAAENKGKGGKGTLDPKLAMQREAANHFSSYIQQIDAARANQQMPPLSEDEKQTIWEQYKDRYGIRELYQTPGANQTSPGKTDQLKVKNGQGQPASPYKEGQTATGPNGEKAVFKNGVWVTQ